MLFLWTNSHNLVDRHFAEGRRLRSNRKLWRHLETCDGCRQRYRAHALLEAIDDGGSRVAQERLAPVGIKNTRGAPLARTLTFALGTFAVAMLAVFIIPKTNSRNANFMARGGPPAENLASLGIYRVPRDQPPHNALAGKSVVGSRLSQGDGLAFSYTNDADSGYAFLMVFAVDAKGHVAWFWPAWQDTSANPPAIAINSGGTFELPEAVFHEFAQGEIELLGLFMKDPLQVKDVEALVAGTDASSLVLPNAFVWRQKLEVLAP